VDVVEVGADPGQVDVVGDHVFVTGQEDATLSRVPLGSGEVTTSGRFDTTGSIAGDGESTLWAVSKGSDEVTQIEAESLSPLEAVPIPDVHTLLQAFVEVGGGSVWVAEFAPPVVKRWDAFTLQLQRTYRLDESEFPLQIGFGDGAAWVALSVTKALLRIDAKDGRAAELEVGNVPRDPVVAFGSVWAAMGGDGTVWRIDPRSGRARAIIKVGKGPWGVAAGKDAVWVTSHCEGTVSRIDPDTDEVVERIELGFFPQWLAVGGGHVWVGVAGGQGAQGLFLEECL
jgi:streptogramin lyase